MLPQTRSSVRIFLACLAILAATAATALAADTLASAYPVGSPQGKGAAFLLANLPDNDRETISPEELRENVDCAFAARGETAWARTVPFVIFLHYVLPHRLINEPFKPYRRNFHDRLAPLVRDCKTTWEAAVRVNLWLAARVEYHSSSGWLTAPADMFKVGYGRCEELAVLMAAAARSVGIPVRGCWVPGWRHGDDNHVWLEVWDRGSWLPLEAVSTVVDPNDNWFLQPARSAPAIYSPVYGDLEHPDQPVHRRSTGYTLLNLTGRYAVTTRFTVTYLGRDGKPLIDRRVCLWTYNYGRPWIVARALTDAEGKARFLTGTGSYIASVGDGLLGGARRVAAEGASVQDLRRKLPESWSWSLEHPPVGVPLNQYQAPGAEEKQHLKDLAVRAESDRHQAKDEALRIARAIFARTPDAPQKLLDSMERCWPSAPRLATEYTALPKDVRTRLTPLLLGLRAKDLAMASLPQLSAHLDRMPDRFSQQSPELAEKTYYRDVTNPRLYREPLTTEWSRELAPLATKLRKGSPGESVNCVIRYLALLRTMKRTAFSCSLPPHKALLAKAGMTDRDKATLGTALLRRMGIPARVDSLNGGIQYQDGGHWRSVALDGRQPVAWPTAWLVQKAGDDQLILLDKNGIFFHVDVDEEEPVTYLPQGKLMVVGVKATSPTSRTGRFHSLPQTHPLPGQ